MAVEVTAGHPTTYDQAGASNPAQAENKGSKNLSAHNHTPSHLQPPTRPSSHRSFLSWRR